jgi:hypothetical protein
VERCDPCQQFKNLGRGHGETAARREATAMPWQDGAVDLIGPWTLPVNGKKLTFFIALTWKKHTVTNLVEVVGLRNKTSAHVALQFKNTWLSRYPCPLNCLHDPGSEFIRNAFNPAYVIA